MRRRVLQYREADRGRPSRDRRRRALVSDERPCVRRTGRCIPASSALPRRARVYVVSPRFARNDRSSVAVPLPRQDSERGRERVRYARRRRGLIGAEPGGFAHQPAVPVRLRPWGRRRRLPVGVQGWPRADAVRRRASPRAARTPASFDRSIAISICTCRGCFASLLRSELDDRTTVLRRTSRTSLYSLDHERSCRRPVTNLHASRPSPVSSCRGRTRYCRCLGGIAAKRGGTGEGRRDTRGSAGAHAARAFG